MEQIAGEGAGWAALVLAVLSVIRNELTNYNARLAARDKAELDRQTALDKQTFDLKVMEIQKDASIKEREIAELREELKDCRSQHASSEKDREWLRTELETSRKETREMRTEFELMKRQLASLESKS